MDWRRVPPLAKNLPISPVDFPTKFLFPPPKANYSHHQGDIQKLCSLKIPNLWPPPPQLFVPLPNCSSLFVFEPPHPSPPPQGTLVLDRTHPLSPSISILVKFKEKKFVMSTSIFGRTLGLWSLKKPQWNLYKVDTIVHDKSAWQVSALWLAKVISKFYFAKINRKNIKTMLKIWC